MKEKNQLESLKKQFFIDLINGQSIHPSINLKPSPMSYRWTLVSIIYLPMFLKTYEQKHSFKKIYEIRPEYMNIPGIESRLAKSKV